MGNSDDWPRRVSFGQIAERNSVKLPDVYRVVEYIGAQVTMPGIGFEDMSGTGYPNRNTSGWWTISFEDLFRLIFGDDEEVVVQGESKHGQLMTTRHVRSDVCHADIDAAHYLEVSRLLRADENGHNQAVETPSGYQPRDAQARVLWAAILELRESGSGTPKASEIAARMMDGNSLAGIKIAVGQDTKGRACPVIGGKLFTVNAIEKRLRNLRKASEN